MSFQQSNRVKFDHLTRQNNILATTVKQLEDQLLTVRKINNQLLYKSPNSINILLKELNEHNNQLESSLKRLIKSNSEYLCEILMKNQLICEIQKQHDQIIANYEEKICELMASLQKKQEYVNKLELKYATQKNGIIGLTTSRNMLYFNENNELKMYFDRANIENSQLKYINMKKQEQICHLKKQLLNFEQIFKKTQAWQQNQAKLSVTHSNDTTESKNQNTRVKIELQMSKYDKDYKEISSKKIHNSVIHDLKLIATHLSNQNANLIKQNNHFLSKFKIKDYQNKSLLEAYTKMQKFISLQSEQIQNLKINIKNMNANYNSQTRYEDQQIDQNQTNIQKCKDQFIKYWKRYEQNTDWKKLSQRCLLFLHSKKKSNNLKRSKSCLLKLQPLEEPIQEDCPKQAEGFSYFLESCDADLIAQQCIQQRKLRKQEEFFNQEISVIAKPKTIKYKNDYEGDLKQVDFQQ